MITPLSNRVAVERFETVQDKIGSIIIPDAAKERPNLGDVLAVGPGKVDSAGVRQPMTVKVGDKILFGKYSGAEVEIDGKKVLILKEDEILGIFE